MGLLVNSALDDVAGRRINRNLAGSENEPRRDYGLRVRPNRLGRGLGSNLDSCGHMDTYHGTRLNETTEAVIMLTIIVATMSKLMMDHRVRLRRRRCGEGLMTGIVSASPPSRLIHTDSLDRQA